MKQQLAAKLQMFIETFCSLWMQLHAQRSLQKPTFTHYKHHHISVTSLY